MARKLRVVVVNEQEAEELLIYFAGSIRGGRADQELYRALIEELRRYGKVLTEHVGSASLVVMGEDGVTDRFIHDRDMAWLNRASVVVAEVTTPSLGVGYGIAYAAMLSKPILALYRPTEGNRLSAMVAGCQDVQVAHYNDLPSAQEVIASFLASSAQSVKEI